MKYEVFIEKHVQKSLEKIPQPQYHKVKRAILQLALNPRPSGYLKLKNREGYRIRIGEYRVIYEINDRILAVYILKAGHRKSIY